MPDTYVKARWKDLSTGEIIHAQSESSQITDFTGAVNSAVDEKLGYRKPSTAYAVGDIAYHDSLPAGWYLECTTPGTSSSGELTISTISLATTVTDNTVSWIICKPFRPLSNAGAHNALFRGKDLTAYFNSGAMSTAIASGKFTDIYPGDYIIKTVTVDGTTYNNVKWIIGDLDYHLHRGDTETTAHHVLVFPESNLGEGKMNSTHVTTGGYTGSEFYTTTLPKFNTGIKNAFGSSHVLSHREVLTNAVDTAKTSSAYAGWTGTSSNWAWFSVEANLFNEPMVYGTTACSSSFFDVGDCNTQVAAMRHNKSLSFTRNKWCWLRAVAYGTTFCGAGNDGGASGSGAANSGGFRPYFLLT